jgi:hypothetical protein
MVKPFLDNNFSSYLLDGLPSATEGDAIALGASLYGRAFCPGMEFCQWRGRPFDAAFQADFERNSSFKNGRKSF